MLSVPVRWVSSALKRNIPSPNSKKNGFVDGSEPLTETHVNAIAPVIDEASSDRRTKQKENNPATTEASNEDNFTGRHIDYSV